MSAPGRAPVWLTLAACALVFCTSIEARKRRPRPAKPAAKASPSPAAVVPATPSPPPAPPVERVVVPIAPHPAEPPVSEYGLDPAGAKKPTVNVTYADPLLGLTFVHPPTLTRAPHTPPVNAVLLAPPSPPFRSNLAILVDNNDMALGGYAKAIGLKTPTTNLTISAQPALYTTGTPEHPTLKLANAQAIVDCGKYKLLFTATASRERFPAFEREFRAILDSAIVKPRQPMETGPGTPYVDPDQRFSLTLPPRFARAVATGAENVRFTGPVEDGRQLMGLVEIKDKPRDWEASEQRLSVMKRGIPGGMTGMMLLSGKVLKRAGQPDALLMTFRYRPKDEEIHEAVLEVPRGHHLVRFTFRGPGDRWALYEGALGASLETAKGL